MNFKPEILDMLEAEAVAETKRAILTLKGFFDSFSAIGDHSTIDLYNNIREAATKFKEAEEMIEFVGMLRDGKIDGL